MTQRLAPFKQTSCVIAFLFGLCSLAIPTVDAAPDTAISRVVNKIRTKKVPRRPSSARLHRLTQKPTFKPHKPRYAAVVMEADSGRVLHQENPDQITHPASLTKMMTLYMIFSALDQGKVSLNTPLRVSAHAARQAPSKLGLKPGDTLHVRDAIMALITKSANDVAATVAENLGGHEAGFADLMTAKAHQLGMNNTYFRNASGLPNAQQITTARDMAVLSRALIREFSHHYHLFKTQSFHYKGVSHRNHNKLAGKIIAEAHEPVIVDGIKTGFINASGYNLAASALQGDKRLIVVVMGGETSHKRDQRIKDLIAFYFNARPLQKHQDSSVFLASAATATKRSRPSVTNALTLPTAAEGGKTITAASVAPARSSNVVAVKPGPRRLVQLASAQVAKSTAAWAVQVGAYRSASDARRALHQATRHAPDFIKKTKPITLASRLKKKRVYRAQFAGLTQIQANQTCQAFAARGLDCLALKSTHRS